VVAEVASIRPFLRWAGSKRRQIPILQQFWNPNYTRYLEPFAGSSCLFFAIRPASAILADKNRELIEAYEVLREDPQYLFTSLAALPRNKTTYYYERSRHPQNLSRFERAVRFIYLNRNCFNGIYRTNLSGQFNVPFGGERTGAEITLRELIACADALETAKIRCWDFGQTLRCAKKGDFVYIDPPYAVSGRRVFREYGAKMFDLNDVERLKNHLKNMHERGAEFVVSYADSSEGRSISADWSSKRIRVARQVAGFSGSRRHAYELLITNTGKEKEINVG